MPFGSLWIPVVVSAVVVFVASSIMHMALKYHMADYKKLPDEEGARAALGKQGLTPGLYIVPYCPSSKEMQSDAMKEKLAKGPNLLVAVRPNGQVSLGSFLGLWFGFALFVSFVAAYVARHTLTQGANGMLVMQVTGTVAFCSYAMGNFTDSIWKAQPWSNTARAVFDAIIYSVLTGLTFKLLWP